MNEMAPAAFLAGVTSARPLLARVLVILLSGCIAVAGLTVPIGAASAATTPASPNNVAAVAGNGVADVSWTAPMPTGGLQILNYIVTRYPGGDRSQVIVDGSTFSTRFSGLGNGISYTFAVVARNEIGDGPESNSAAVVPSTSPDRPSVLIATPTATGVRVSWAAPRFDGGSRIIGYEVTSSPGGRMCTTSGATYCTVTGTVDTSFGVVARNAAGTGLWEWVSTFVREDVSPDAPSDVSAVEGNAEAVVSWTAPASNSGSAITSYRVTASPGGNWCNATAGLYVPTTCTVRGLENSISYTFAVEARNTVGFGPTSNPSYPVVPRTVPDRPTSVIAQVAGDGQARVTWVPPRFDAGSAVTGYSVTASAGGNTCTTTLATSCTVTGLTNGTMYRFMVAARNVAGDSSPSAESNQVTPNVLPSAPSIVTAVAGDASSVVYWTASAPNGGTMLTGYRATASPGGQMCTTTGATSCTVSGLANGFSYTFTVVARNAMGDGPVSTPSLPVVPTAPPANALVVPTVPPANALVVPTVPPAPSAPTAGTVGVNIRATSGKSKLFVDVNPNKGKGFWTFQVEKQRPDGSWQPKKTYKTSGSKETRSINLARGTYRVVVDGKYGYQGTPSAPVYLKR